MAMTVAEETVDQLAVRVYATRQAMGDAAAAAVATRMRDVLARQAELRMIFAAAPSQNELLAALCQAEGIDWARVTAFQMDDYLGLPPDAPQRFSHYLADHLFDHVHPGNVQMIDGTNSAEVERTRYADLINAAPIDIVCLGIGENGHIAFNDPPVADFHDPEMVKVVTLDAASRHQQVHDGCFAHLDDVPTDALTLTIPALLSGEALFCIVPGPTKRAAVHATLRGPVTTECPASILRQHPTCILYLDEASYPG